MLQHLTAPFADFDGISIDPGLLPSFGHPSARFPNSILVVVVVVVVVVDGGGVVLPQAFPISAMVCRQKNCIKTKVFCY